MLDFWILYTSLLIRFRCLIWHQGKHSLFLFFILTELFLDCIDSFSWNPLKRLKSGFNGTINWEKYRSTPKILIWDQYLIYLNDSNFQGVNRFFCLYLWRPKWKNRAHRILSSKSKKRRCNNMIDERNVLNQPVRNNLKTRKRKKTCYWSRIWLHNWLFIRLFVFQRKI